MEVASPETFESPAHQTKAVRQDSHKPFSPEGQPAAKQSPEAPDAPVVTPSSEQKDKKNYKKRNIDLPETFGYRWKPGAQHVYEFELHAELDGNVQTTQGTCHYTVGSPLGTVDPEDLQGSGTGFAVSSEGYFITCAHVVQGAVKIEVILGDRRWVGRVVAADSKQDLALIQVEATGLPALALAVEDTVELGQSVAVVGFPLSPLLGASIKMSRGSVTGAIDTLSGDIQRSQVDATINPGNSSGPLIGERGEVVGVASELLTGSRLADVGFAVPVKEVRELLRKAKVKATASLSSVALRGPQLAKLVTPAIALIEVTGNPAAKQHYQVNYSASYHAEPPPHAIRQWAAGNSVRLTALLKSGNRKENGSFAIDKFGAVTDYQGDLSLPITLDHVGSLFVESLSSEGDRNWEVTSLTELQIQERSPFPMPRSFRHSGPRNPFPGLKPQTKTYPAVENRSYKIVKETDKQLTLEKAYKFQTLKKNRTNSCSKKVQEKSCSPNSLACPKASLFKPLLVIA